MKATVRRYQTAHAAALRDTPVDRRTRSPVRAASTRCSPAIRASPMEKDHMGEGGSNRAIPTPDPLPA
ncbi:hypothetical protein GCM10010206_75530 [Streptomyces cinerochromogenes]|nr:hypothetical protein GCM10010206_75530 [Streptomyces cinerochromogenes]